MLEASSMELAAKRKEYEGVVKRETMAYSSDEEIRKSQEKFGELFVADRFKQVMSQY